MATCKDCVHYELCFDYTHLKHSESLPENREDICEHFKNKANVIEVPDDTIIYIKNKWLVLNSENENLSEAIKYCMDYLTKDARSEDNGKVY